MCRPSSLAVMIFVAPALIGEAKAQTRSVPRAQVVANAERDFAVIDSDRDGMLSRVELETFQNAAIAKSVDAANAAAFSRLDLDKNGQLSASEFAKINPAPKAEVTAAFHADTNKDNKLSLGEHRAATIEKFNKLDGNKDGILTAEEIRAATALAKK